MVAQLRFRNVSGKCAKDLCLYLCSLLLGSGLRQFLAQVLSLCVALTAPSDFPIAFIHVELVLLFVLCFKSFGVPKGHRMRLILRSLAPPGQTIVPISATVDRPPESTVANAEPEGTNGLVGHFDEKQRSGSALEAVRTVFGSYRTSSSLKYGFSITPNSFPNGSNTIATFKAPFGPSPTTFTAECSLAP